MYLSYLHHLNLIQNLNFEHIMKFMMLKFVDILTNTFYNEITPYYYQLYILTKINNKLFLYINE